MEKLTSKQIGKWLKDNGLAEYQSKFEEEQIDGMGLLGLNENDLESLIPQRGPRAKIRFLLQKLKDGTSSQQTNPGISAVSKDDASPQDRSSIKERLSVIRKRGLDRCSLQTGESLDMKKAKKETYKMTIGWLKKVGDKYRYVMPRKGGGAKKADVPRAATYTEMCNIARSLFSITETDCYLGNYNGEPISTSITCEVFVKSSNFVTLPRLYVVTVVPQTFSSDDDTTVGRCSLSPPCLTPQKLDNSDVLTPQKSDNYESEIMSPEPNYSEEQKLDTNDNIIVLVEETDKSVEPEGSYVFKRQVTMEEVNGYIEQLVREEEYDSVDNQSCRLAGENYTPVHMRNAAVMYYIDLMKQNGKEYEVVDSSWGPFAVLPDEDLCTFFTMREGFDVERRTFLCPPILYYLALKKIPFQHVSENVIEVNDDALEDYNTWLEEMKSPFKSG